jgi:hypothetical protein
MLAGCGGEPLHEDEAAGVLRAPIVGGQPAAAEEVYSTVGLYEPGEQCRDPTDVGGLRSNSKATREHDSNGLGRLG